MIERLWDVRRLLYPHKATICQCQFPIPPAFRIPLLVEFPLFSITTHVQNVWGTKHQYFITLNVFYTARLCDTIVVFYYTFTLYSYSIWTTPAVEAMAWALFLRLLPRNSMHTCSTYSGKHLPEYLQLNCNWCCISTSFYCLKSIWTMVFWACPHHFVMKSTFSK